MNPVLRDEIEIYEILGKNNSLDYLVKTTKGDYKLTAELYEALRKIDSHRRLEISGFSEDEILVLQNELEKAGIIRTTRWKSDKSYNYFTLYFFSARQNQMLYSICSKLDGIIKVFFLIVILLILIGLKIPCDHYNEIKIFGFFWLTIVTTILHEAGHGFLAAMLPYCNIDEIGIVFYRLIIPIPVGAYLAYSADAEKSTYTDQMRLAAGGVVADVFVSSILFVLARACSSGTLLLCFFLNLFNIVINSLPYFGADGALFKEAYYNYKLECSD